MDNTNIMTKNGIRVLRQTAKLKLKDLATASGVSAETIKLIERGLCELSFETASLLSAPLGTSAETLLEVHRQFMSAATPGEGYTTNLQEGAVVVHPSQPIEVNDPRLKVVDLFCGAGGLSYGFERTGKFVTVAGLDLLKDRIETFTANHRHAFGLAADIRKTQPESILELTGPVDVVVGGPPCQGFSSIRPFRNLTEQDPRNSLVEHYVLMLVALQPKWFVFENVVGLVSHEGGRKLEAIIEAFTDAGYKVSWRIVNAASFGIPQNRERVVIVGNREGVEFEFPRPTHFTDYRSMAGRRKELLQAEPLFDRGLLPAVSLIDAIGDLPPVNSGDEVRSYRKVESLTPYQSYIRDGAQELTWHRATQHSEKMMEIIRHAGSSIACLPVGMVTSGFSSCYSRLDAHRPSNTITVNFVHPSSNRCIHPYQDRALTPREGARIQSFPDTFDFCGTSAQVVKQIGNAVPPKLGQVIAEKIWGTRSSHPSQRASLLVEVDD